MSEAAVAGASARPFAGRGFIACCWRCRRSLFAAILHLPAPHQPGAGILLAGCLLLYLALIAAALIEGLIRPLQTLSNVVSSLREGDYSFRARGASAPDALGELAAEVNALADLLQKQRVRSLEATALLARILEVMHAPLFAFDRESLLQLVNNAGLKLLGLPYARCFGHSAPRTWVSKNLLAAPDQTIHSFGVKAGALAAAQGGLPPGWRAAYAAAARRREPAAAGRGADRVEAADPRAGTRTFKFAGAHQVDRGQPAGAGGSHGGRAPRRFAISGAAWGWWRAGPTPCIASCSRIGCWRNCLRRT